MSQRLSERLQRLSGEFVEHLRVLDYSEKTRTLYGLNLRHFIAWVAGQEELKHLSDLRRSVLASYQCFLLISPSDKTGKPRSSSTRNHFAAALRSFFRYLVQRELLLTSPGEALVNGKAQSKLPEILTVKEVLALLAAIPEDTILGKRDRAAVEVLYGTGLRVNEFFHLDLDDLCFSESLLRVRYGKGGKQRMVPLTQESISTLKTYIQFARPALATGKMGGKHRDLEKHTQAVWLSKEGARWAEPSIRDALKKYASKARIKKTVTPHLLRHSCATHLLVGRADIRHIQFLLGHEKLSTTEKYTHLNASDLKACIQRHHPRSLFKNT